MRGPSSAPETLTFLPIGGQAGYMPAGASARGQEANASTYATGTLRPTAALLKGTLAASKSPTDKVAAVLALPPLFLRLDRRVRQPPLAGGPRQVRHSALSAHSMLAPAGAILEGGDNGTQSTLTLPFWPFWSDPFLSLHRDVNRLFDDLFRGVKCQPAAKGKALKAAC